MTSIKWNNRAFYQLRSSPAVVEELERRGRRVMNAANDTLKEKQGYRMSSFQGKRKPQGRWFVNVYTSSNHAKRSNAIRNTLLRAMDEAK
jgi:hypothetical protein